MKKIGSGSRSPRALQAAPELIEVQAYMPMDPADRERLKKDIEESGEVRDPIKIYKDRRTGQDLILGGYNRQQIALELNIERVPVDEYEGTPAERRDLVIKDNLNRRHLTAEQKRDLIKYFLKQDPGQSDAEISRKTKADRKTIRKTRKELEQGEEFPTLPNRKGADGKTYRKPVKKPAATVKRSNTPEPETVIQDAKARNYLDKYLKGFKGQARQKAIDRLIAYLESMK